jgi:hypothetical protein
MWGKIVKNSMIIKEEKIMRSSGDGETFRDSLEIVFLEICKKLDIEAPLWMKKNTREFAAYNKTVFFKEQFYDKVYFDFFEINIER